MTIASTSPPRARATSSKGATSVRAPLKMPPSNHVPKPYTGPSRAELLAMRKKYTNPAIFTLYGEPLLIVEGHMQWLFDETGKRYLDMFAGIVTVSCGHCHPKIVAAIEKQVETLQHATTIYLHPNFPLLAKKLASKMPKGLDVTYFVNEGGEGHDPGGSPSSMGLTSHNTWKLPVPGAIGVHHAVSPDPYRSQFSGTPEEIASKSAEDILGIIRYSTPGRIAAFISEPIQGVGGATHGARNYLGEAYRITREHGGLCIADEVQTGFGRTGDHYWGFENFDVVPDFVTMAKGIGNGVPLGAVTTRMEIAQALTQRIHFNTFGGNPVCMAAGLAVIDVIDEDGLQENSRVLGKKLKDGFRALMKDHALIGDVRGMGLMLGVALVQI